MRVRLDRVFLGSGLLLGGLLLPLCLGPLLGGCSQQPASAPFADAAELPVTRVVLYQNGVGYFERSGSIDGNLLTLQIHPTQINDLLKSLTVIDAGTGRAVSVSLPLEQNADRILNELPEQVRNAGGVLEVLRVFRGAHVEISGQMGTVEGRVVGIENLETGSGEEVKADWRVSLKTDDDQIIVYPVKAISSISLYDKTLNIGLERSLDVSLGEGGWKPISVGIRLAGEVPHKLLVSYIVEMPRWKPAYRLVLGKDQKPLLQGWAVVDNVSGESWRDVRLSLVSGSPISFRYDLHSPQYTERVDLTPERAPLAVAPPPSEAPGYAEQKPEEPAPEAEAAEEAADEGYSLDDSAKKASRRTMSREDRASGGAPPPMAPAPMPAASAAPPPPPRVSMDQMQSQGSEARAESVGVLFRYDLRDPVTVPDRSSTLVSIVNQRISGEEVVYFRPELSDSLQEIHPYRAVKFQNATGFTLESGPITVYSEGTFVGEGFVERMQSGRTSFLTFAVDGNVLLNSHGGTREEGVHLLRIVDGMIVSEMQRVETTTYEVKNRHNLPQRAYIRTPKRSGWDLRQKPEGTVETPEAFVVPLNVPAKGEAKTDVELVQRVERNLAFDSTNTMELFRVYLAGGKAPPAIAKTLKQVLELQSQVSDKRKDDERVRSQYEQLSHDQDRVRANLDVLRKTPGNEALRNELAQKLAKLEGELGKLSGRLVALSEEVAELQAQMKVLIMGITLDNKASTP
jgi:hypothetical protein